MKKNILISLCIAICGIIMLSFIEIMKKKGEAKPGYQHPNSDTTIIKAKVVETGITNGSTSEPAKRVGR